MTANEIALLATPPTVTTTFPLVAPAGTGATMLTADHSVGVAGVPLKVMVLVPCVAPKLVPAIVTIDPTAPSVGDRLRIVGVEDAGTVNGTSADIALRSPVVLYACTTKKYVCPGGTGTTAVVTLPTSIVVV